MTKSQKALVLSHLLFKAWIFMHYPQALKFAWSFIKSSSAKDCAFLVTFFRLSLDGRGRDADFLIRYASEKGAAGFLDFIEWTDEVS